MKPKNYSNKKPFKKRGNLRLFVLIALALILIGAGSAYYFNNKNISSTQEDTSSQKEDGTDLSPPSEEELKATEQHKNELGDQAKDNQTSSTSQKTNKAKPIITSSGVYDGKAEVGARVPGVFESDGTCTLKLSKGGRTVTKSQKATPNVSEMSCGFISVSTSKLSAGNWSAVVSYKSNKHSGTSDPVIIKVQ